jgi:hypothetical protein
MKLRAFFCWILNAWRCLIGKFVYNLPIISNFYRLFIQNNFCLRTITMCLPPTFQYYLRKLIQLQFPNIKSFHSFFLCLKVSTICRRRNHFSAVLIYICADRNYENVPDAVFICAEEWREMLWAFFCFHSLFSLSKRISFDRFAVIMIIIVSSSRSRKLFHSFFPPSQKCENTWLFILRNMPLNFRTQRLFFYHCQLEGMKENEHFPFHVPIHGNAKL